jgi:transposase
LFGLTNSEGAISNANRRMGGDMDAARKASQDKLLTARINVSEETTTRVGGATHWQWPFLSDKALLHKIAPSRARRVTDEFLAGHKPNAWVSDRYAGQQEFGRSHQVCLAYVLRDVQYGINSGDPIFAPKIRDHLQWRSAWASDEAN